MLSERCTIPFASGLFRGKGGGDTIAYMQSLKLILCFPGWLVLILWVRIQAGGRAVYLAQGREFESKINGGTRRAGCLERLGSGSQTLRDVGLPYRAQTRRG